MMLVLYMLLFLYYEECILYISAYYSIVDSH